MLPSPLAFVDVETWGPFVVELAVIRLEQAGPPRVLNSLVRPAPGWCSGMPGGWVHGITPEELACAPSSEELLPEFLAATDGATVVGHNVEGDVRALGREVRRLGGSWSPPTLCTLRLARALLPGLESYGLGSLCSALGAPALADAHRALPDAEATAWLLGALVGAGAWVDCERLPSVIARAVQLP